MDDNNLVPEVQMDCPEPNCTGRLRRIYSTRNESYFYGCDQYNTTGCTGSIGCHRDGSPLGIPADAKTRQDRRRAHLAFDRLWKPPPMTRTKAYHLAAQWMNLTADEMHIAKFDSEQCEQLIAHVQTYFSALAPYATSTTTCTEDCPWKHRNPEQLAERLKEIDQKIEALEAAIQRLSMQSTMTRMGTADG